MSFQRRERELELELKKLTTIRRHRTTSSYAVITLNYRILKRVYFVHAYIICLRRYQSSEVFCFRVVHEIRVRPCVRGHIVQDC